MFIKFEKSLDKIECFIRLKNLILLIIMMKNTKKIKINFNNDIKNIQCKDYKICFEE